MMFTSATNFYRKSGVAEWRDLRFLLVARPAPGKINPHFPPATTGFMMHKARFNSLRDMKREP